MGFRLPIGKITSISGDETDLDAGSVKIRLSKIRSRTIRTAGKNLKYVQAPRTTERKDLPIHDLPGP